MLNVVALIITLIILCSCATSEWEYDDGKRFLMIYLFSPDRSEVVRIKDTRKMKIHSVWDIDFLIDQNIRSFAGIRKWNLENIRIKGDLCAVKISPKCKSKIHEVVELSTTEKEYLILPISGEIVCDGDAADRIVSLTVQCLPCPTNNACAFSANEKAWITR